MVLPSKNDWAWTGTLPAQAAGRTSQQLAGQRPTSAVDIFAWAVTMIYAATGRLAFGADSVPAVMHRIMYEEPDVSGLPRSLQTIAGECLDKNPDRRPKARDLLLRLVDPSAPRAPAGVPAHGNAARPMAPADGLADSVPHTGPQYPPAGPVQNLLSSAYMAWVARYTQLMTPEKAAGKLPVASFGRRLRESGEDVALADILQRLETRPQRQLLKDHVLDPTEDVFDVSQLNLKVSDDRHVQPHYGLGLWLTVTDNNTNSNGTKNSAKAVDANIEELYLAEDPTGNLIDVEGRFDPMSFGASGTGKDVHLIVKRKDSKYKFEDTFAAKKTLDDIPLPVDKSAEDLTNARDFNVTEWIDSNGNGSFDSGADEKLQVVVHIVRLPAGSQSAIATIVPRQAGVTKPSR